MKRPPQAVVLKMFSFTVQVSTIQEKISALDTAEARLMGFSSPLIRGSGYKQTGRSNMTTQIWVSTFNSNKLIEIKSLLADLNSQVFCGADLKTFVSPEETASSFEGNARIKTQALFDAVAHLVSEPFWVLGEDSGLEVEALEKQPGVFSARYAGPDATDKSNLEKLIQDLKTKKTKNFSASFVTSLVAKNHKAEERVFSGQLKGSISLTPLGTGGFGYDPIFIPENENQSLAQLGPNFKNKFSHRAQVLKQFKTACF